MAVTIRIDSDFDKNGIAQAQASLKGLAAQAAVAGGGASKSMQAIGTSVAGAGKKMSAAGRSMSVGMTLPIVGLGAAAFTLSKDFGQSMTKITALTDATAEQTKAWETDVRALATTYGASAVEAADALYFISSAGLKGDAAISALEMSLKASAVGLGETQVVADLATSAMNGWKDSNLTAAQAGDILAATVSAGKLSSEELAGAMGSAIPIATKMGVGFDELGASFAAMSKTGTSAAEASTQTQAMMVGLLKPTDKASAAMKDLGLNAGDLRDQIKSEGLLSVLETLREKFDGNDEAVAKVFPNIRALKGVNDLLGNSTEDLGTIFGETANSAGDLGQAFKETSETPEFKYEQAVNGLKTALGEAGTTIVPVVSQIAESLSGLAQRFSELSPGTQSLIVKGLALAAVLGPVLMIVGKLTQGAGMLIVGAGKLATGIGKTAQAAKVGATGVKMFFSSASVADGALGGVKSAPGVFSRAGSAAKSAGSAIASGLGSGLKAAKTGLATAATGAANLASSLGKAAVASARAGAAAALAAGRTLLMNAASLAVRAATIAWTAVQWLLNAALSANPIGLIVVAVAALIAGIVLLWNNCETFRNVVMAVWGAIKTAIGAVVDWIKNTAVPFLQAAWDAIKNGLQAAWNAIQPIFNTIKTVVMAVFGFIKTYFTTMFTVYKTIFTTAWNVIKTVVTTAVNVVKGIITAVWNGIKTYFTTMFNIYKTIFTTAWNVIKTVVTTAVRTIKAVVTTVFNAVKTVIQKVMGQAKAIVSGAVNAIKSAIQKVSQIVGMVSGFFSRMVSAIVKWIGKAVQAVAGIPGKIVSALGNLGRLLWDKGVAIVQGLISGIGSMAGAVVNALLDLIPGPLKKFAGALGINSPAKKLIPYGAAITEGVAVGIGGSGGLVDSAMGTLAARATSAAGRMVATFAIPKGVTNKAVKQLGGKGAKKWEASWTKANGRVKKAMFKTKEKAEKRLAKLVSYDGKIGDGILDAATEVLDRAKSAAQIIKDAHSEIKDSLVDFGSIATSPTNLGAGGIIRNLGARLAAIKRFGKNMATLTSLGLNAGSLKEIYGMGPVAGSQIAEALIKQGAGAVGEVNSLESQIRAESASVADVWTTSQYGRTGAEAQAVYDSSVNLANGAIQVTIAPGAHATDAAAIRNEVEAAFRAALPQVAAKVKTSKGKKKKKK